MTSSTGCPARSRPTVVTDGPQYAASMLDIPTDSTGASIYRGPYEHRDEGSRAFDKAVVCDGPTITFHLNRPVADFNYTVALTAFGPVPEAADDGEAYDRHPVSSGPYKIQEYEPGEQLVLVRNPAWNAATDPRRRAYPDRVVVRFGISSSVIDHRMIKDSGADRHAVTIDPVEPQSLATVFEDDRFRMRRIDQADPVRPLPRHQHGADPGPAPPEGDRCRAGPGAAPDDRGRQVRG